jgi:hypothetical protein
MINRFVMSDPDHFRVALSSQCIKRGEFKSGHFFAANRRAHVISRAATNVFMIWMSLIQIMNTFDSNDLERDGRPKTAAQFSASCYGTAAGLLMLFKRAWRNW